MNNRITEIAKESGFFVNEGAIYIPTTDEDITKLTKKFAQAIIRECAEVALREDHDPYECILAHFEVKND